MRAFVIGSKELSCIILDALLEQGHEVLGVYSRDNESGMQVWLNELHHRSLAELAESNNIPVHYGMKVNSEPSLELLRSLKLDVIFSCFWSELFKEDILSIPKHGVFNFHTAYLPNNRGSRPIPWALIKGDEYCGMTLHQMETGVDNGPILDQEKVFIGENDTAESLYGKVMDAGKRIVERSLHSFESETLPLQTQDESKATYQLRGEPYGGQLHHSWTAEEKDRFRRAMYFPPFRAHRPAPQEVHSAGVRLTIITEEGQVVTGKEDKPESIQEIDWSPFQTTLTGGNAEDRKVLRQLFAEVKDRHVWLSDQPDLHHAFPVLESLLRRGARSVTSKKFSTVPADLSGIEPFRYHNGLLEIPLLEANTPQDVVATVKLLTDRVKGFNIPVYVTLMLDGQIVDETFRLLSKENLTQDLRLTGIAEVCDEFDTEYENIRS